MKELALKIKVSNNLLKARREALGLSGPKFSQHAGVAYSDYVALENLHQSARVVAHLCRVPVCIAAAVGRTQYRCKLHKDDVSALDYPQKQRWSTLAIKLAAFYGCTPEEIFPNSIRRVTQPTIEREVDVSDLECLASLSAARMPPELAELAAALPSQWLEGEELRSALSAATKTLSPREQLVLSQRFGLQGDDPMTLLETADSHGVSVQRVADIQAKALRKLRHPSRSKKLKTFIEVDEAGPVIASLDEATVDQEDGDDESDIDTEDVMDLCPPPPVAEPTAVVEQPSDDWVQVGPGQWVAARVLAARGRGLTP